MSTRESDLLDPATGDAHRLALALEAAEIGTWEWDLERNQITWSENFERQHGFERGAFGRTLDVYQRNIHPDDRQRITEALQTCAAGGPDYSVEYRLIAPGGETHHVEAHGRLLRNAEGAPARLIGVCRDVSDRVHLLESERRARLDAETIAIQYRSLAQAIPAHVWTATPDGALDFVNERVLEYFGRTFAAMIGSGWQGVIHPADIPTVLARWTHSLSTGESYDVEFRLRRHDGAYRWYRGRAIAVRDVAGSIVQWMGTNTDIDDEKRSLGLMATQIEVAQLLVNATALDEVAEAVLETVCVNLGWNCAQLWIVDRSLDVLRRSAGWCDRSLPACDFDTLAAFDQMNRGVGLPGRIWDSKAPAWIADVRIDPNFPRAEILRRVGLRSAFGFPLIVAGEVSAILELFSSENRMEDELTIRMSATLGGQIGHFIERQAAQRELGDTLDRLRRLQSVTDAALSHLSLDDLLDDLLGRICEVVVADMAVVLLADSERNELYPVATFGGKITLPRDLRIAIGESLSGRAAAGRTTMTLRHATSDLSVRQEIRDLGVESIIAVPLLAREHLIGVLMVGAIHDRSFKQDEIEFIELIAQRLANAVANSSLYEHAREANRLKDRFISIASHELRTPMTGILGWTSMLRTETDPAVIAEALDWIEMSVRTQAQLIEDLLDSTRIREGKLELRREQVDLRDVVRSTLQIVAPLADQRGVLLDSSLPEDPVLVFGDRTRLKQVVWNLLGNAIKFTPSEKHVRTAVTVDQTEATITVLDEGEGIAPDFLPNIFKAFEQDSKGKRAGGLGLGLHIVATIVGMHGGRIEARSEGAGKGAVFTVRLPLAQA